MHMSESLCATFESAFLSFNRLMVKKNWIMAPKSNFCFPFLVSKHHHEVIPYVIRCNSTLGLLRGDAVIAAAGASVLSPQVLNVGTAVAAYYNIFIVPLYRL